MATNRTLRNTGMVQTPQDDPADPVLFWQRRGDPHAEGKIVPGVPARDLTQNDLNRAVFVQTAGRVVDGEPRSGLQPGQAGFDEAHDNLRGFLLMSGLYSTDPLPEETPEGETEAPANDAKEAPPAGDAGNTGESPDPAT